MAQYGPRWKAISTELGSKSDSQVRPAVCCTFRSRSDSCALSAAPEHGHSSTVLTKRACRRSVHGAGSCSTKR